MSHINSDGFNEQTYDIISMKELYDKIKVLQRDVDIDSVPPFFMEVMANVNYRLHMADKVQQQYFEHINRGTQCHKCVKEWTCGNKCHNSNNNCSDFKRDPPDGGGY